MRSLLELKEHDLLKILTEYSNVEKELEETKRKITILDKDIFENNSNEDEFKFDETQTKIVYIRENEKIWNMIYIVHEELLNKIPLLNE